MTSSPTPPVLPDARAQETRQLVERLAYGYELMHRVVCNMAGTSGADGHWYMRMAQAVQDRVSPIFRIDKESNALKPGDCLVGYSAFMKMLADIESAPVVVKEPTVYPWDFLTDEVVERFWSRVDKSPEHDGCWIWQGPKGSTGGYGSFSVHSIPHRAHRLAWEIHNGKRIPDGLFACHTCDIPACVNPNHIWLGTPLQNNHDMLAKRRGRGAAHANLTKTHCAKGHPLTGDNVRIRNRDGHAHRRCKTCRSQEHVIRKAKHAGQE